MSDSDWVHKNWLHVSAITFQVCYNPSGKNRSTLQPLSHKYWQITLCGICPKRDDIMFVHLPQTLQTLTLEMKTVHTGIKLRSVLLNLWFLIGPHVESGFPSAAPKDIFSQTLVHLLKVHCRLQVSLTWCFIFGSSLVFDKNVIHIHRLATKSCSFPLLLHYFCIERYTAKKFKGGWQGGSWKSAFQPALSGVEVIRIKSVGRSVGVALQGCSNAKSKDQFLIPQPWAHLLYACC